MKLSIIDYNKKINNKSVLSDINLEFEGGKIYGLYGHNGSGKTMLLRAISGLIKPTSGEIVIDGKVIGKDISFPSSLGIHLGGTKLLPQYTSLTNLEILNNIDKKCDIQQLKDILLKVGLNPDDKRLVKEYSLGMNQKLSLAQALMSSPELILLDEPTNGLDDESTELIINLLLELKDKGSLIIVASHIKSDLERLSDELIKISDAKIVS